MVIKHQVVIRTEPHCAPTGSHLHACQKVKKKKKKEFQECHSNIKKNFVKSHKTNLYGYLKTKVINNNKE